MPASGWDCAEEEKIYSYVDCPELINQETCFNYTFSADNFEQVEPDLIVNELDAGEGCWMQINRTIDGSYGTVSLEYDNRYLYVFDDLVDQYESGMQLGLVWDLTNLLA